MHTALHFYALFPNGIERLLEEQNGSKNLVLWDIHPECVRDKWRNLKWVVPIKVTGWKFIHCQIPFNGQEERYLTLHGDKKIYFTPGYSLQILKDRLYDLSSKQQNVMKQLKKIKEKRIVELVTKVLPHHHPLVIPRVRAFASFEPKDVSSDHLEQEASNGRGVFIQALWTLYANSNLNRLAYKAWKRHNPQNLTTCTLLAQAVLDGCYAEKWPDTVFQVHDVCSICLSPMHWPEKTHCGHGFHLRCLSQHLDVSNTCPVCRALNPLRTS
ncbi:hypothetical protein TNCV_3316871 [Trichonephila clavipes]|nr:hypothetical protein TNCV_3316871 [Trichonephila clavipes]